jgi:hypothetical protein
MLYDSRWMHNVLTHPVHYASSEVGCKQHLGESSCMSQNTRLIFTSVTPLLACLNTAVANPGLVWQLVAE